MPMEIQEAMEQDYNILKEETKIIIETTSESINGQSIVPSNEAIKLESDLSEVVREDVAIDDVIKEEVDLIDAEDDDDNDDTAEDSNALQQETQMDTNIPETKKRRRFGLRKCNICQQLFKTLVDLRKHIFTHSNERPFACIPCKMRFMKRCHLQQHIKLKHKVLERKTNKQGESNLKHTWNLLQMQCKLCKKILLKKNYKRHMITHDRLQIYLCSICNYKSREKVKFLEHMQLLHQIIPPLTELKEDLPFSCKKCAQSFAYKICFDKHKCIHREIRKYKCSFCEYKSSTKDSVKEHAKNKHDADVDLEEILEDLTVNLDEIKARLKLNKKAKPHPISKENIVPQRNSIFLKEEGTDVEGDDMQYKINQKGIDDIKAEIIEIKDDEQEEEEEDDINSVNSGKYDKPTGQIKSYVEVDEQKIYAADVPETGNSMTIIYKEDKHYKVVLDEGVRAFQCTLCNRILKKRYLAERHVLRHTGDHPLSCSFCPFRTRLKDTMHQHLKTEHDVDVNLTQEGDTGESTTNSTEETHYKIVLDGEVKVYKCNFCDRTTKEKYLVERHILTHTGEFPLSCSLCSIKTRQKKSMRLHLKKEHGLTVTFKQIAKDGTLTLDLDPQDENTCRIAIKNGHKVYQCNACNKVFSRKDNLDKHYTVHTGLYSFHCTLCKYKTNEKGNMQKHMLRKHKIENDSEDIHKHMASKPRQCDDSSLTDPEESNAEELRMQGISDSVLTNGGQDNNVSPLPQGAARYTVIIENDARSFKCNVCGEISTEKCLFNAHFLAHTEKLPYSCTICGHKARSKKTIKNHMRRRHKINVKVQDIPEEIVNSDTGEDDEGEEEEEENNSVPEMECKYIEIEEENAKFLKCLLCDKKLKTLKKMKLHFLIHQGKFVYTCSKCKYKTVEKDSMQQHMKVKHKMDVSEADILNDNAVTKERNEHMVEDIPQHSEVIYVKEDMDVDYESN